MNLSSVTDNIEARIAAARQAAHEAADVFNKQIMGSKAFFSSFSTWNKLNNELDSLEKVANLMQSSALAGLGKEAISSGIDRIFSTGIKYNPSMISSESIQNAANGALFGQGALDTLNHTFDGAANNLSSSTSGDYVPYGEFGNHFSDVTSDSSNQTYDQGDAISDLTSRTSDWTTDGNNSSNSYDKTSGAADIGSNESFSDKGASWGSVMSGDYLSGPNAQDASVYEYVPSDHTRSISAWSGPSTDQLADTVNDVNPSTGSNLSQGTTSSSYSTSTTRYDTKKISGELVSLDSDDNDSKHSHNIGNEQNKQIPGVAIIPRGTQFPYSSFFIGARVSFEGKLGTVDELKVDDLKDGVFGALVKFDSGKYKWFGGGVK